ncbi:hypothetical protein NW768_007072 [Fusarium equiseti]|uniref:Uncharacterized protein n=1 Tax=Fusarium equiseti TaxID=61235 RepID=A0ABQ8RA06_FUSEQ|nr:hypothetical protein NW768_007072 [Fusarium equiseti]
MAPSPPKRVRPKLIEATYVMSRDKAMSEAGDIVNRLGNRGYDQKELAPEMDEWLSIPVIKVLNEDFKNKVYMWCSHYGQGWLQTIRESNEDLLEYRYVDTVQEPDAPSITPDTIQEAIVEKIDAAKDDILEAHRQGLATIMAKIELLHTQDESSVELSPTKRRRVNTRSTRNATAEKAEKIHQGLRYLVGANSELLTTFEEFVGSMDPDMLQTKRKPLWSKDELESLKKEARAQGVNAIEYKLLDRSLQEMQDADLPIANLAALADLLVSSDQLNKLAEKFPFPFQ